MSVHVWQDLVLSLSLLSGDCVTSKLDWTFRLYDLKHDGVISRDELLEIVASIYDLVGDSAEPQVLPDTVQQHADAVFQVRFNLTVHSDNLSRRQTERNWYSINQSHTILKKSSHL